MSLEKYKDELLSHFSNAVKQVQMEQMSTKENSETADAFITNDNSAGRILCTSLDMIFSHGLRHKEYGCWEAVRYFCRNDVIYQVEHLRYVKNNLGKGRAWIFIALNERELEGYLNSFQMDLAHIYKYYHRSAMLCSSQISVMQTLISGLDHISFKLFPDVPYLDFKVVGTAAARTTSKTDNYNNIRQDASNRGSSVQIDTSAVTGMVTKVKGIFSKDKNTLYPDPKINKRTVVAVNNHHNAAYVRACSDCKKRSELVCLCVKEKSKLQTTLVPSSTAQMLENLLSNNTEPCNSEEQNFGYNSNVPYTQRVNPFNDISENGDLDTIPETVYRRCDSEIPIFDSPLEVIRKKKTRKKHRFTDSGSDISSKSEDVALQRGRKEVASFSDVESSNSCGSMNDIFLSNPLIDFDPCLIDNSKEYSTESVIRKYESDNTKVIQGVIYDLQSVNSDKEQIGALEMCNTTLTQTFLPNQHASVSSQDSLTISDNLDLTENYTESVNPSSSLKNISGIISFDDQNRSNINGTNDIISVGNTVIQKEEDIASNFSMISGLPENNFVEGSNNTMTTKAKGENIEKPNNRIEMRGDGDGDGDRVGVSKLHNASLPNMGNREASEITKTMLNSDVANLTISAYPASENNNFYKTANREIVREEQKRLASRMRKVRRYRSESEDLLNALTQKEVERLRNEIKNKLKPAQDRLEKVRKSIADKTLFQGAGSFRHDSSFMLDRDKDSEESSSYSRPLFDDSSDEIQSFFSQDNDIQAGDDAMAFMKNTSVVFDESIMSMPEKDGLTSPKISTPQSYSESETPHGAVANIDNTLRLYMMLEILNDENEAIIKMFHVSTGHAEGNWTPLYLVFSDSNVYFLRSGDGNCPYQAEEVVSYDDLDYISVGSNSQTMQFVFYKNKLKISNSKKPLRGKVRTKLTIDTADKDLTNLIISNLSKALVSYTRQQSVIKVCPPIFHDAKEHQISLRKYIVLEGLTGDLQLYQLVHWEDPGFLTGASMSKISLEGRLKYKAQTFWGTSWRPAYFVLSGGMLYQYEDKDSEKPEISYKLTQNNCVGCKRLRSNSSSTPGLIFELTFKDNNKIELCGFSDIEVTEWLQSLCMIVSLDQACMIDKEAPADGIVLNLLNHDALVPCSLIIVNEQLLLCHEDHHTGFCRTLAKADASNITEINIDKKSSFVCEIIITIPSERVQSSKWGIFFPCVGAQEDFLSIINNFSKAPIINDVGSETSLAHCLEARTLLDNRWTRTDNLLRGRRGGLESYTFL